MPGASSEEIARLEALHAENPRGRVFTHLAEAYRRAGHAARARELLRRGLADHPDYPSAHVVLGRVLEDLGEREAAERSFARVLDLDPHNMIALRRLAAAADEAGRTDEALEHWTELAGLEPGDAFVEARVAALTAAAEETEAAATRSSVPEPPPETATPLAAGEGGEEPRPGRAEEWDPFDEEAASRPLDAVAAAPDAGADAGGAGAGSGDGRFELDAGLDGPDEDIAEGVPSPGDVPAVDARGEDESTAGLPLMDLDAVDFELAAGAAAGTDASTRSDPTEAAGTGPGEAGPAPIGPDLEATLLEDRDAPDPARVEYWPEADADAWPDAGGVQWPEADSGDSDADQDIPGVETETLGDLYAAQGLHGRAAEVYRRLLRRNPSDARVQAKLHDAEARVAAGQVEPVRPEWGDVAGSRPAAPPGSAGTRARDAASTSAPAPDEAASDDRAPLEVPPGADVPPEEEPLTFGEPFLYGAVEEVRLGAAWAEPGAVADAPGPDGEEPAAAAERTEPGALWTGQEFEGSVFAPGVPGEGTGESEVSGESEGTGQSEALDETRPSDEPVRSGAVETTGEPAGGSVVGAAIPPPGATAYDAEPEEGAPFDGGPEEIAAFDGGPQEIAAFDARRKEGRESVDEPEAGVAVEAEPGAAEALADEPEATETVAGKPGDAQVLQESGAAAAESDSLAEALAGALAADRQEASIRDALRGVLSWTPRGPAGGPAPWGAPSRPGADAATPPEPFAADTEAAERVVPPEPTPPPDPALEPWSLSRSSAAHGAPASAEEGTVLELGEAELVRPPRRGAHGVGTPSPAPRRESPVEPAPADAPAAGSREPAPASPAGGGAEPPEGGSEDLGDLARSLLDASVSSDEEAAKAEARDDEEVEVFRSWLRSLGK